MIATELVTRVRKSVTIDWTLRERSRAKINVLVNASPENTATDQICRTRRRSSSCSKPNFYAQNGQHSVLSVAERNRLCSGRYCSILNADLTMMRCGRGGIRIRVSSHSKSPVIFTRRAICAWNCRGLVIARTVRVKRGKTQFISQVFANRIRHRANFNLRIKCAAVSRAANEIPQVFRDFARPTTNRMGRQRAP